MPAKSEARRRVLVVGASGAIGSAIARLEIARGAEVTGTWRTREDGVPEGCRRVRLELGDHDWGTLEALTTPPCGRWSAVYLAAGEPSSRSDWPRLPVRSDAPDAPVTDAEWNQEAGHGLRTLRLARTLRAKTIGPIVLVCSAASRWTMPGASPYAATHGTIDGAARSWMAESRGAALEHGARIRLSRPGIIWGPIWEKLGLRASDLRLIRALSTSPETYARRLVRYADSGWNRVHSGTWDARLTRWAPPALLEPLTAWAMGWLLARRNG